jgi:hypothetical protein
MKTGLPRITLVAVLATLLLAALPLAAQQGGDEPPEYVPPKRGAPEGRIGGGTRGLQALPLTALAPGHTGLTLSTQPVLYYYTPAVARLRVTLRPAGDAAAAPLLDQELASPRSAGIQRLDLGTLGVKLAPGVEYRWSVVLAGETREASATIQRVEPSAELARRLSGTSGRARYALLAKEGVWYDALDEVSRAVDTAQGNTTAARHRAALLEQIGLTAVARAERQRFE